LSTSRRRQIAVSTILVGIAFALGHLSFRAAPGMLRSWDAQAIDQFFVIRSSSNRLRPHYDRTVVHLDVNDSTIDKLKNYYLDRSHYARVMHNLSAMNAAVQAYDIIFAAPSTEKDDRSLMDATAESGNVYFGLAFSFDEEDRPRRRKPPGEETRAYLDRTTWQVDVRGDASGFYTGTARVLTFPRLASPSRGLGYLSIKPDDDGVYRRIPLLVRYEGGYYPSLSFRVACDYLDVSPANIIVRPGKDITLKDARRPGGTPHDIAIPIDDRGAMVLNFVGPWECMVHYDFADVYRASDEAEDFELWREELAGKIILISDVSTGSADTGRVPGDINFPLSGLHASAVHTILTEQFLDELTGRQMLLVELLLAVVVLCFAIRFPSFYFPLCACGVAAAYIAVAAFCFFYLHVILSVLPSLVIVGSATVFVSVYRYFIEEKEKEVLRKTFEAYFPPAVVGKLVSNPELAAGKGQKKELTVLFSDIEGFTGYSAALHPDEIQRLLNEYFDAMVEIVFKYEGTVDKYIGDGLMVFFGDPEPQPDHALRCVRAAIEMQKKTDELRRRWSAVGSIPIRIRIGINTGEVVVGNMGSARRLSYTVLGSAVNLAQRLERSASPGGILISQRTCDLVKGSVSVRSLGAIAVKGIGGEIPIYEILEGKGEDPETFMDRPQSSME